MNSAGPAALAADSLIRGSQKGGAEPGSSGDDGAALLGQACDVLRKVGMCLWCWRWGCGDVFVVLRLGFRKVGMCLWCCVRLARVLVIVHPGRDPFFFFTHPTDPHTLHRV